LTSSGPSRPAPSGTCRSGGAGEGGRAVPDSGAPPGGSFIGRLSQKEAVSDFARFVSPGKVEVYRRLGFEAVPGRREGVYVWDLEDKRYINCRSSGGVFNLGHRPPRVVEALRRALDELDAGDHMLMSEQRARLARRLAELTPGDIQYSFFVPGGAEAIDLAIKLARGYTGRPGIVSAEKGYHGHTGLALAAGDPHFSRHFEPLAPGFTKVPFGDAGAMEEAVGTDTAAVLLETIQATGGIMVPPPDYYPRVREICDRAGAVLILDEVQAGLGRTGRLWAIDEWGVVPDIIVLGKGLGGALYPVAAACWRPHLDTFFQENPFVHLSSYAGSDLGCVAAMAVLEETTAPGFLDHVRRMGTRLEEGFGRLVASYPDLAAGWRGRGLFLAFELTRDELGPLMTYALAQFGVVAVFSEFRPRAMQILPPLVITETQVGEILEAMDQALTLMTKLLEAGFTLPALP